MIGTLFRGARPLGLAATLCALLSGCATPAAGPQRTVAAYASSADGSRRLAPQAALALTKTAAEEPGEIVVDPVRRDQTIVGYGAAMTDASAQLFQQALKPAERDALFADLFGREGIALNFVRVPIGASDFSSEHYSLDDVPAGASDPALAHFSMAGPQRAQIPALKAMRAANPQVVLMGTPWSAPGWMKDGGSLIKGQLKPAHYAAFARYFVRYLDAMEGEGLPVRYLSVQNEPAFEPENYPGMRFTAAARARFIGDHLGPMLKGRKQAAEILDWDHNWDKPEEPLGVLADPAARAHVRGVAWHCYAGDPAAMETVRRAYPDKEVFFTECSGGEWSPNWGETLGWMTDNLIIAPSRSGSRGTLLWNLALDENYGPHLGGCGDCRGVVTIDSRTRRITRNVEYYVLGHVSRFVRPGAFRIASEGGAPGVTHVAFRNPDGGLVLLAHNASKAVQHLAVRSGRARFAADLPAGEVMTFVWTNGTGQP